MSTLKLTIHKQYFDMIASGEKLEEYRQIKPHWFSRLIHDAPRVREFFSTFPIEIICSAKYSNILAFRQYDYIEFINGYKPDSPRVTVQCLGIRIGVGKKKWGAPPKEVFIIRLGKIKN